MHDPHKKNAPERSQGEQAMTKGQSLQDPFLNALRRERVPVSVYLVNGIKLQGTIESFDQFVVLPPAVQPGQPRSCLRATSKSAPVAAMCRSRAIPGTPKVATRPNRSVFAFRSPSCSNDPARVNTRC